MGNKTNRDYLHLKDRMLLLSILLMELPLGHKKRGLQINLRVLDIQIIIKFKRA